MKRMGKVTGFDERMVKDDIRYKDNLLEEINKIGLRISYFRRVRNMTQAELAEKVSINKHYLSHIESGSANKALSLPVLIRIARVLGVKLSVLVDLDDWTSDSENSSKVVAIKEMRHMFDEMCQFNKELDRAMERMDEIDSVDFAGDD